MRLAAWELGFKTFKGECVPRCRIGCRSLQHKLHMAGLAAGPEELGETPKLIRVTPSMESQ